MIIRAPRPQSKFYLLDKRISEDIRLSWGARGMLIFLLGKPDHWEVSVTNLVNETAGSLRPGGNTKRDGVKAILAELGRAGYLTRSEKPRHNADGSFAGYDYVVSETPVDDPQGDLLDDPPSPDKPSTVHPETVGSPSPDEPSTAEPSPPHPTQASTEVHQDTEFKQGLNCAGVVAPAQPDLLAAEVVQPAKKKRGAKAKEPAPTNQTWQSYAAAYAVRYGAHPLRNATVNGQLSNLIARLGAEEAPLVAAWYVDHNEASYVKGGHTVALLLRDAEKLRTQWVTGRRTSAASARQADATQANLDSHNEALALLKAKGVA